METWQLRLAHQLFRLEQFSCQGNLDRVRSKAVEGRGCGTLTRATHQQQNKSLKSTHESTSENNPRKQKTGSKQGPQSLAATSLALGTSLLVIHSRFCALAATPLHPRKPCSRARLPGRL